MNPIIVGASIGAVASIAAALISRSRASAKSDAMQQASPTININQSQQRGRARSQTSSFFVGVAAACLAVVAIVIYLSDESDPEAESGRTETEGSTPTTNPILAPTSTRETTALEPITSDATACPDEQEYARARDAAGSEFSYRALPTSHASIVLQMSVEKETEGGSEIIITICQDGSGSYWYFSRWLARPTVGLVTPASKGDAGFDATFDFDEGDIALYQVRPTEVIVSSAGTIQHLPVVKVICVEENSAPEAFSGNPTEPCTETTVNYWAF